MNNKFPCALLVNDLHVSKDNIPEFQKNWDEAVSICKKLDIDYLIVGGDVWLSRSSQTLATLLAVRQAIINATNQGIYIIFGDGNHDKVDQELLESYNLIFSGYESVEVVSDHTVVDLSDDLSLFVMSYFPENGSFTQRLNELKSQIEKGKKNVLYIHEGINGGLAIPSDDELPASIFSEFDCTLVGHYHNRKKVAGTNIEYIGSSRQHNFGEDEEKGYTVLYSDGSYEFIKNEVNIRYRVIDIDLADINEEFLQELNRIKKDGRYRVKVRISCKSKEASTIDKQKLSECGATKIELVTEKTEVAKHDPQSLSQKFDKKGIKQEYTNFCTNKGIANVEMGLKYLDKIN